MAILKTLIRSAFNNSMRILVPKHATNRPWRSFRITLPKVWMAKLACWAFELLDRVINSSSVYPGRLGSSPWWCRPSLTLILSSSKGKRSPLKSNLALKFWGLDSDSEGWMSSIHSIFSCSILAIWRGFFSGDTSFVTSMLSDFLLGAFLLRFFRNSTIFGSIDFKRSSLSSFSCSSDLAFKMATLPSWISSLSLSLSDLSLTVFSIFSPHSLWNCCEASGGLIAAQQHSPSSMFSTCWAKRLFPPDVLKWLNFLTVGKGTAEDDCLDWLWINWL